MRSRLFLILVLLLTVPLHGWALAAMPSCPGAGTPPACHHVAAPGMVQDVAQDVAQDLAQPGLSQHDHGAPDCKLCAGCACLAPALSALSWPAPAGRVQAWPAAIFAPAPSVVPPAPEHPPRRALA